MKQVGITQIAFRIDELLAKKFKSECALRGETLQTVLVRAVNEYLAREKEKPE